MEIISGKIAKAQKIILYGPEGIGKSTFASKFPTPLFLDTEGSTNGMDVDRVKTPKSWAELSSVLNEFRNDPGKYKTLVIDTADWAEILCTEFVCDHYQKKGIEDFGYGKGFTYVQENFGKLLNFLSTLIDRGINVVITAHAKMRKFEQPDEAGAYDRWELKLSKGVAPLVKEWADAVFFVNYKTFVVKGDNNKVKATGGKRVMYTQHHTCWDAKNRYGLPAETEFDYSVIAPYILNADTGRVGNQSTAAQVAENRQELDKILDDAPSPGSRVPDPIPDPNNATDSAPGTDSEPNTESFDSGIPEALLNLMDASGITEHDIRLAVSNNGYYPFDTPIEKYDPDFINGKLIAGWDTFYNAVMYYKNLPYSGANQ